MNSRLKDRDRNLRFNPAGSVGIYSNFSRCREKVIPRVRSIAAGANGIRVIIKGKCVVARLRTPRVNNYTARRENNGLVYIK